MLEAIRNIYVWPKSLNKGTATMQAIKGDDLPCPWCQADTREGDPRCPSCGRRFG